MSKFQDFRVIISGSKNYNDYDQLKEACDHYLKNKLKNLDVNVIVLSGSGGGADKLGEQYAKERGLELEIYSANWDRYGKSASYKRNVQMTSVGNALIAFRSSYSDNRGTDIMIDMARKKHLLVRVIEED